MVQLCSRLDIENSQVFLQESRITCQKNFECNLSVYIYFFLSKTKPPLGLTRNSIIFAKLEVDLEKTHLHQKERVTQKQSYKLETLLKKKN